MAKKKVKKQEKPITPDVLKQLGANTTSGLKKIKC